MKVLFLDEQFVNKINGKYIYIFQLCLVMNDKLNNPKKIVLKKTNSNNNKKKLVFGAKKKKPHIN